MHIFVSAYNWRTCSILAYNWRTFSGHFADIWRTSCVFFAFSGQFGGQFGGQFADIWTQWKGHTLHRDFVRVHKQPRSQHNQMFELFWHTGTGSKPAFGNTWETQGVPMLKVWASVPPRSEFCAFPVLETISLVFCRAFASEAAIWNLGLIPLQSLVKHKLNFKSAWAPSGQRLFFVHWP